MSQKNKENAEKINLQDEFSKEDYKNDQFQIQVNSSNQVNFSFFQMFKYSELIQEEINKNDIIKKIELKIRAIKNTTQIKDESIKIFFDLLNEEKVELNNDHYSDLLKLSTIFKVKSLTKCLSKYAKKHSKDIDFIIIQILESTNKLNYSNELLDFNVNSNELEKCLVDKINECFTNEKFNELPISIVHRIIKQSSPKEIDSDLLYDFIQSKKEERYILFGFLNIQNLKDDNFNDLYQNYINDQKSSKIKYYEYLNHNLELIKLLKDQKKSIENQLRNLQIKYEQLQSQISNLNDENQKLKADNQQLQNKISQKDNENQELMTKIEKMNEENQKLNIKIKENQMTNKFTQEIPFQKEFEGILNYFRNNSNIKEEVNITHPSNLCGSPETLYKFENNKTIFHIENPSEQWICFEFKKHKIILSDYTIRSYIHGVYHPKSWIIEGSNDLNEWYTIDEQKDCLFMKGRTEEINHIHTFSIQNQNQNQFKYIRLAQTDKNWGNHYKLAINCIEFYGRII